MTTVSLLVRYLMLITYRPAPPLASHVETIWFSPHVRERSLPTGRVDIVVPLLQDSIVRFDREDSTAACHFRGAVVSGAHDRYAVRGMGGASSVIGVHFRPGGAAAFFAVALSELRNRTVLLDALWGPVARELRERLQLEELVPRKFRIVEELLLSRLPDGRPVDTMVARALRALEEDPSFARIDVVQQASNCSPQQFVRRFEAAVGVTPKRYARVLRFSSILSQVVRVGPRDWAQVAADGGYFDQSHLIREFKHLAGLTPTAYRPVYADSPSHVPIIASPR
jgi:AraC-like DNA-binding protein